MALNHFFLLFRKNEYEKELRKKLSSLERNIAELEKALYALQDQNHPEEPSKTTEPPIIIEKINIEKIILDKYELNNNFGQLGIKELRGKLNIGATYGGEFAPKLEDEESDLEINKEKGSDDPEPKKGRGPKINIKAKKEN